MSDNCVKTEQNIFVNCRNKITVTGIRSVDSFCDNFISITTLDDTVLNIEGFGLTIKDLNLENCQLEAEGNICALYYDENKSHYKKKTFSSLFKRS